MAKKTATKSRDEMAPNEVLLAFFTAMCKWERHAFRVTSKSGEAEDEALLEARNKIIAEYCTSKRRANSEPLSCGDPPIYDPKIEDFGEIVEESANRVVIHTQRRDDFEEKRRYVLLRKGGIWQLESWQWFNGAKWDRGII